jgi:hypothetical protein
MMRKVSKRSAARGASRGRGDAKAWLGAEIELIIRERDRLLHAAGAAASLFSALDPSQMSQSVRRSARELGAVLQSLPEETLTDAIEMSVGSRGRENARPH